ncbi:hypothetical protein F4677DRAFT_440873 [Hypoxylon crocopeplum]|nr:hypothetical protein F4677DRAFT_440873 [Hypoxylon crocopeplum]
MASNYLALVLNKDEYDSHGRRREPTAELAALMRSSSSSSTNTLSASASCPPPSHPQPTPSYSEKSFGGILGDTPSSWGVTPDVFEAATILCSLKNADITGSASLLWSSQESTANSNLTGFSAFDPTPQLASKGNREQPHNPRSRAKPIATDAAVDSLAKIANARGKNTRSRQRIGENPSAPQTAQLDILEQPRRSCRIASIENMHQETGSTQAVKQRVRINDSIDASAKRFMDEVGAAVGGQPADNAPKEDWNRYLENWTAEKRRRDEEDGKKSWAQLTKAEQFTKKMGEQQFQLVSPGLEEEIPPRPIEPTMASQLRDWTMEGMGLGAGAEDGSVQTRKRTRETSQAEGNEPVATSTNNQATMMGTDGPPPNGAPPSAVNGRRLKRRRRMDNLESDLGRKWEPRVDEDGHRPTRRVRKL